VICASFFILREIRKERSDKMPISEKRKASIKAWDTQNMRGISCRVRKHEAEIFKEYCIANGKNPGCVLKEYVLNCNEKYRSSKDKLN